MFAGKKSAQIREILISESAWEEMTCLFAPSLGIKADVASVDFANAVGEKADLYITIKELANQFPAHCHVAIIRSYVHKAKIAEDITDALTKIAANHS